MPGTIKNILFDLGGVLIDLDVRRSLEAFRALLAPGADSRDVPVTARGLLGGHDSELIDRYQTGDISTDDFIRTILSVCRPGTTPEQVREAWFAMLLGIPEERKQLLQELVARGYQIYVLSNINEMHVDWTLAHCPELRQARRLFFSNEIRMAKPDPGCFELVIRETGIRPEETLYIDDLQANIDAGRAAGFRTLHVPDGLPDIDGLLRCML
ncbi:MAG: HAD family phosphatase [Paludibacteraceae bacterium]|nr:HAD family phosphatase [Paludibacteraceae bacterium]